MNDVTLFFFSMDSADQFSLAPSASRFLASGRLPPAIAAKIPAAPAPPPPDVDSSAFEMLQSMGFSRDLIISTLRSKRNNVDEVGVARFFFSLSNELGFVSTGCFCFLIRREYLIRTYFIVYFDLFVCT